MQKEDFNRVSLHSSDSNEEIISTIKMFSAFGNLKVVIRVRDIKKRKKRRNELLKKYRKEGLTSVINRDVQFVDFHDNNTVISVTNGITINYILIEEINRRVGLKVYEI